MAYYRPPAKYRWHAGFVAWLLHRITGLLLILYLFLHERSEEHTSELQSH